MRSISSILGVVASLLSGARDGQVEIYRLVMEQAPVFILMASELGDSEFDSSTHELEDAAGQDMAWMDRHGAKIWDVSKPKHRSGLSCPPEADCVDSNLSHTLIDSKKLGLMIRFTIDSDNVRSSDENGSAIEEYQTNEEVDGWYILYTCISHVLVFALGFIANSCYKARLVEWEKRQDAALDQAVAETETSVKRFMKTSNHDAAIALINITISRLAASRRQEHVDTGAMKHLLAKVYIAQRVWQEAEAPLREALGLYHQLHNGVDDKHTALVYEDLGGCLRALGRKDEALYFLQQAVDIYEMLGLYDSDSTADLGGLSGGQSSEKTSLACPVPVLASKNASVSVEDTYGSFSLDDLENEIMGENTSNTNTRTMTETMAGAVTGTVSGASNTNNANNNSNASPSDKSNQRTSSSSSSSSSLSSTVSFTPSVRRLRSIIHDTVQPTVLKRNERNGSNGSPSTEKTDKRISPESVADLAE